MILFRFGKVFFGENISMKYAHKSQPQNKWNFLRIERQLDEDIHQGGSIVAES